MDHGTEVEEPLLPSREEPLHKRGSGMTHLLNLLLMSVAFLGIFSAFGATQNLVSSIIPGNLGYWSVATVYVAFCFGALLISPALTKLLKPRLSLVLGSLTYLGFILANLWPDWATLIPTAALLGVGAAVLWAAQGAYLTATGVNYAKDRGEEVRSAMGFFNGIFWAIFQCTQVIGNLLGAFVLSSAGESSTHLLFYIFVGIAGAGSLLLCFLRPEQTSEEKDNTPLSVRILDAIFLMKDKRMLFLIPTLFYSGIEMGFIFGDFTKECISNPLGTGWIGFVMSVFGATDAIGSFVLGRLSDKAGKRLLVAVGFFTHILFHTFWIFFLHWKSFDAIPDYKYMLFITAAIYGLGDAVWNMFPSIMMSSVFTDQAEAAFSVLKLFNSLGFAAAFVYGPLLPFLYKQIIALSVLFVAVLCLVLLDRFIVPIDGKKADPINATKDA